MTSVPSVRSVHDGSVHPSCGTRRHKEDDLCTSLPSALHSNRASEVTHYIWKRLKMAIHMAFQMLVGGKASTAFPHTAVVVSTFGRF